MSHNQRMEREANSPGKGTAQHGERNFQKVFRNIGRMPFEAFPIGMNAVLAVRFNDTPHKADELYCNRGIGAAVCAQFRHTRKAVNQEKVKNHIRYKRNNRNNDTYRCLSLDFHFQIVALGDTAEQIRYRYRTKIRSTNFNQ